MSRQIPRDQALSDEDREYLVARGDTNMINRLDLEFGVTDSYQDPAAPLRGSEPSLAAASEPAGLGQSQVGLRTDHTGAPLTPGATAAADEYDALTNEELRDELEERELSKSGNKQELITRLREDDAQTD
jgi:hypothetical protein